MTALAYPDATGYLDIPAGTYDLEVCAAGTDTCPLDLDPVAVEGGPRTQPSRWDRRGRHARCRSRRRCCRSSVERHDRQHRVIGRERVDPALVALAALALIGFAIGCRRFAQRTDR